MLGGPASIVAAALVVAGASKMRDPAPTGAMLRSIGLPGGAGVARGVGLAEIAAGTAALAVGGLAWAAPAALYGAFAIVLTHLVRVGGAASCGCFGAASSPPSGVHIGADVVAAIVTFAALLSGAGGLAALAGDGAAWFAATLSLVVIGTWAFIAVLTVLPATLDAARSERSSATAPKPFRLAEPVRR